MDFYLRNPIPIECYNEIFYQLRNDRKTLHSCLFVNRFFCNLATPLLWGTPFEHINLENPKSPLIISTYISSLVDEDKSYIKLTGIPLELPDTTYFYYPEYLTSFNSQLFQLLVERWLMLADPFYCVNYKDKLIYVSYLVSNLLFASTKKLESLKYFGLNSQDKMHFIKHKEFDYSISNLVNLEINYFAGENNPCLQSDEDKLNKLFNTLSYYTHTIRFVKINISSNNIISFTTRFIKSIVNFIAHQFNLEGLSLNESLVSENLFEFGEIIRSQQTNLKYLTIGGKPKNFTGIIKALQNCISLESLTFEGKEDPIIEEDYMVDIEGCDIKMSEVPVIEEFFEFNQTNQLKIGNICCIEDCEETTTENYNSDDIVALGLEKVLSMTNVHLRTLNLGKINTFVITTLGKFCYNLTHLSCELSIKDAWWFTKLLGVLRGLEHLKLKLEFPSMLKDHIMMFANSLPSSLPSSLQKLGLDICGDEDESITFFLSSLLEKMGYNNLFELYFYNDQMIRNENLQLILQFVLNRNRYNNYGFTFKYITGNFNQKFDQILLQSGRNYMNIIQEEISNFHQPFYEPIGY